MIINISYSNGGTAAQLAQAINYLNNSAQYSADLAQIRDSPNTYTISVDPNGSDGYAPETGTITWNPIAAMLIPMVGIQSPALGLAHETHHAACADRLGPTAFANSQKTPSTGGWNGSEIVVSVGVSPDEQSATLAEQIVSQQLGGAEPFRSGYHIPGLRDVTVTSPTFHTLGPVIW